MNRVNLQTVVTYLILAFFVVNGEWVNLLIGSALTLGSKNILTVPAAIYCSSFF